MKILIAEDDLVSCRLLEANLLKWGHDVVVTHNGKEAWEALQKDDAPKLLILDWMMPEMDGVELCTKLRSIPDNPVYIILLTAMGSKDDIIRGLKSGANDYVAKPFDRDELQVRVQVGQRVVELQASLERRVKELKDALSHIKQLQGLLPICSYCKKIRDDKNYWQQIDIYISERSNVDFSHSICPDCYKRYVLPELEEYKRRKAMSSFNEKSEEV